MQSLGHLTGPQIDAALREQDLFCYREYFMWGQTPAYRNRAGTQYRFVDHGDVLTPTELLERLLETWRPAAQEERAYASAQLRRDLLALPNA